MALAYSNGDFSASVGIGGGNNHSGWNAAAAFTGYGLGYGRTKYMGSESMDHKQ